MNRTRDTHPDNKYKVRVLGSKVLCVASISNYEEFDGQQQRDWAAYIGAVIGWNHDEEWEEVADLGDKLTEEIAIAIWPSLKDIPYRR